MIVDTLSVWMFDAGDTAQIMEKEQAPVWGSQHRPTATEKGTAFRTNLDILVLTQPSDWCHVHFPHSSAVARKMFFTELAKC